MSSWSLICFSGIDDCHLYSLEGKYHSLLSLCPLNLEWTQNVSPNKTQNIICNSCGNNWKKAIYIITVHTVVIYIYLLIHCFCASPCSAEDNTDKPQSTESPEMLLNVLTKRNLLQYKQLFTASLLQSVQHKVDA